MKIRTCLLLIFFILISIISVSQIQSRENDFRDSNLEFKVETSEWVWDLDLGSKVEINCLFPTELNDDSKLTIEIDIRLLEGNHETQWESITFNLAIAELNQNQITKDEIGWDTRGINLNSGWHNENPDMRIDFDDEALQDEALATLNLKFYFSIDPNAIPFNDVNVIKDRTVGTIRIIPESSKLGILFFSGFSSVGLFGLIFFIFTKLLKHKGFQHKSTEIDIGLGSVTYSQEYTKTSRNGKLTIKPSIGTNLNSNKVKLKSEEGEMI